MRAFWSDPYLWVHLAGLAVVPVLLEVCLVGLAMGDPLLPGWVEIVLVAIAGIAPILWMQWQRPFSIYSLVAVALTPSQLTDDQRRILKIFKSQESRIVAAIAAVVLFLVLVKVYDLSPIATHVAPQLIGGRLTGLVIAAIAFLLANLFVQVPVSVLRALAGSQNAFAKTIPYPSEQVGRDFSLLGIGVKRILPPMVMEQPRPKPSPPVAVANEPLVAQESQEDDLWDEPIAPAASLAEPLLDDGVTATAVAVEDEAAIADDTAIANDDAWEASESVEEIAERGGDDLGIAPVEAAIAAQTEAPEPEGVWETSVELPIEESEPVAASASEADVLPDDDRVSFALAEDEPEGDALGVDEPPNEPDTLAFDELFDEAQAAEDPSDAEPSEETPEVDSVGHDLIPEWDELPQPTTDSEHQG